MGELIPLETVAVIDYDSDGPCASLQVIEGALNRVSTTNSASRRLVRVDEIRCNEPDRLCEEQVDYVTVDAGEIVGWCVHHGDY